jgi:hypothetical protein
MESICNAIIANTKSKGIVRYCVCPAKFVRDDGSAWCGMHLRNGKKKLHAFECSICLLGGSSNEFYTTSCNHMFHENCIDKWFETGNVSCPLCRKSLAYECPRVLFDAASAGSLMDWSTLDVDELYLYISSHPTYTQRMKVRMTQWLRHVYTNGHVLRR